MRTTLNIEDETLAKLKKYAEDRRMSLGQAASSLIERGVESVPKFKTRNGFALIESPPGSPEITEELLDKWEAEEYEEEYKRAMSLGR